MSRPILLIVCLLSLPAPARARNTRLTQAQAHAHLQSVYTKGYRTGVAVPTAYVLLGATPVKGDKITIGRRGMVSRNERRVSRLQARGNRITVTTRWGAASNKRALHEREVFDILGKGLAVSTTTTSRGKRSETHHSVSWKNSISGVQAPLSGAQLTQLRRELSSPAVWLKARFKALVKYRSRGAIPAMELETALSRMGLESSVDWR
jgi:hypothetical protein